MSSRLTAARLLRAGLAFTFLYASWSSFTDPASWIGFFPRFLFTLGIPDQVLLAGFSLYEVVLGLWLLVGRQTAFAALLAAATLAGIVVLNWGALPITFRDAGLFFAALALFQLTKKQR